MTFSEMLNQYISQLGCTAKELAAAAGVSEVQLSRWRNGKQTPAPDQAARLAEGITALAGERNVTLMDDVDAALADALAENAVDYDRVIRNFNALSDALNIRSSELAKELSFDPSYLSRIKTGQRRPADLAAFVDGVCRFIARRYTAESDLAAVASLTGADQKQLTDVNTYFQTLTEWLPGGEWKAPNSAGSFLKKLDAFDLNEYIRSIHFDELKVPTAPFQFPTSRSYTGLREMMEAELSFQRATVTSRSSEPVLIYSDMPMEKMAKDPEFPKKWMFGMAMMLKKGLHLDMIHNVDRPFHEMMLGLEAYIPLYMTGQISPYYLKNTNSGPFRHLLEVSGAAALSGEAIKGSHESGRYYLSKSREDLRYYRNRANDLLKKASPLMEIYRADGEQRFRSFLTEDFQHPGGDYRLVLSAPPVFTISDALLAQIIAHNHVAERDAARIMEYVSFQRKLFSSPLDHGPMTIEVPELDREEFAAYPLALSLSGMFYETDVFYTYEEYREHLRQTLERDNGENIAVTLRKSQPFRSIQIIVNSGKWAMVSKNKAPAIHFVMRHPKMVEAIERFTPLVVEGNREESPNTVYPAQDYRP